jgi:transcriptional regulator with XRE-family HTH domain
VPEMTDIRSVWADAIRLERLKRRLNQEDVAEMTGLDQTTVSKAEQGTAGIRTYEAIARALAVNLIGEVA